MKFVLDFLKRAETCYFTTADGNQPGVRFFGTASAVIEFS